MAAVHSPGHAPSFRVGLVPPLSVLAASLLAALPVVATAPILPPFGLLMLLNWRLLRPALWPAWAALPLGLADDLLSGQPLGSGMALWTLCFLAIDRIDLRLGAGRDHLLDWSIGAVAVIMVLLGGGLAAGLPLIRMVTIVPQMAMTILCFPAAARATAALDRWRLRQ